MRRVTLFSLLLCVSSAAPVLADSPPEQPPPVTLPAPSDESEVAQLPTEADMVKTFAQFEAEEVQKAEWLKSPEAIEQREASRRAYADLTAFEAEQLLSAQFQGQLDALEAEPARFLSDATLARPLAENVAAVIDEGQKQVLDGDIPVRAPNEEGDLEKVDLNLEKAGSGWEPANPLVDVRIAESADDGVEIGNEGIRISLAGAEDGTARQLGEKNVFFGEVEKGSDSDLLIAPIAGGVEIFNQLRSEESPETLRFDFELPAGAELRPNGGGATAIASNGSVLGEIPPPTAIDAQGTSVPVDMKVEGNSLVLHVNHSQEELAYPILVDPTFQDWYWHNWYNGEELQALSNGAWQWNSNSSWIYGSTSCIYTCWSGSHRGLYISTPSGSLPANGWGQWYYTAPNAETYLANAWVSPFWRDNHTNCPQSTYGQPYDYNGMWNETSWNRILYNEANYKGSSDIESWGRAFMIGMGTSSGVSIPCWRDVMAAGVAIWLEDWSRPYLTTTPTYKWTDTSPTRLNVSAYDSGLGVQRFQVKATNASGGAEEWWTNHSCTGVYESPCPHTWNLGEGSQPVLNYSPAALPEGIVKLSITGYDAATKPTFTTNELDIQVDHAAPTLKLSGTLTEQAKLGTELPSYTIRADASDGIPGSKNPADARSGVTSIVFEQDGKVVSSYNPGCSTQSCSWFRELEVPASELSVGSHTLKVKATDVLGHVATKEVGFTTGDKAPPSLSVTGMPTEARLPGYASSFGSEGAGAGQLKRPSGVAVDPKGNLWVADRVNKRIEQFNEKGEFVQTFGKEVNKTKTEAAGTEAEKNVCTAASGNVCQAGKSGSGNGQFSYPTSLAIDPKGNLWVLDGWAMRLQQFNEKGEFVTKFAAPLEETEGIAVDAKGNIWAADTWSGTVKKFSEAGTLLQTIGKSGTGAGQLGQPTGVAIGPGGNLWVADWSNYRVTEFNEKGEFVQTFGKEVNKTKTEAAGTEAEKNVCTAASGNVCQAGKGGGANDPLNRPSAVSVDSKGTVWVIAEGNGRVEAFNEKGEYLAQFGAKGTGSGQFSFSRANGLATDTRGSIWVTDPNGNRVEKWLSRNSAVGARPAPVVALAADAGFGVTSVGLKLTNEAGSTEVVEEKTQSCPKGACSLSAEFNSVDLSEKAPGFYILTVKATDASGKVAERSTSFSLDPGPPNIALAGTLAERAGAPLNASSGELSIKASEASFPSSGVKAIYVEREHQRVAAYAFNCAVDCREVSATYRYSADRDGARRSTQPAGKPTGSTVTSLSDVACLSASDCHAVGYYKNSSGTIIPLAEHWDGTKWSVKSAPNPAGSIESRLQGVSCVSASSCTAVGYATTGPEAVSTLVERYDGTSWKILSSPNPAGFPKAYLYDVTCVAANDCWAVGKSSYTAKEEELEEKIPRALIERWGATETWTISSLTGGPKQLKAVACSSSTSCHAVTGESATVERWNGSSWSAASAVTPPNGSAPKLKGIACRSEGTCAAVGSYSLGGHTAPLVERWSGSSWSVQAAADPTGVIEESTGGSLEGISCPSAAVCTAVGSRTTSTEEAPLVESWDGTDWAMQPASGPIGATTAALASVACAGSFECAEVGSYGSPNATAIALKEEGGIGSQTLTVEAVDKYGDTESRSISVDVPEEEGETPACSEKVKTMSSKAVVNASQAVSTLEGAVPTTVAASKATTRESADEQEIDPSYSSPQPNLESLGNLAEGETAVHGEGGFTLEGIACITPAQTTTAATEAKVVNSDAAVFANTAPQTDTAIRPTAGGTAIIHSLRGPEAPASFSWNVTVNPGEKLIKLPSGAIAITRKLAEEEGSAEVAQLSEPEGAESPAVLNDAATQLEVAEYQLAKAQASTEEEVVAVIPRPWVVLAQGGVVPAQIELKATESPTEYNVVFVPPPFELNIPPPSGNEAEELIAEATISAVVNGRCLEGAPCGVFDADKAARYAEYFGNPAHSRNPKYLDFGSNNCTNFVSQILARGGMSYMRAYEHGDGSWWYQHYVSPWGTKDWTDSWVAADILPRHLWRFGLAYIDSVNEPWGWARGNIIAEDWYGTNGKGDFNHVQFVVGSWVPGGGSREPLIANESAPQSANYSHMPWVRVKERIEAEHGNDWNRVPLAVRHTIAELNHKLHDPSNLYTSSGVFKG
jgi:sugar lactone lactonase YvrE